MPRAKRYHIPGYVWHITHRCHKREFLLKFSRDRRRWMSWLFEAKKRYGLSILDFMVTSNHIHLLVFDLGKKRNGAFWQDRYHATAVETGEHLRQCIVYIDMNMVRAGAVVHPSEWEFCGYNEIQKPKQRYSLIDRQRLYSVAGSGNEVKFRAAHESWIDEALRKSGHQRENHWTESIAVGNQGFVEKVKEALGFRARGRHINKSEIGPGSELREHVSLYKADFGTENGGLSQNNGYYWNQKHELSEG